MITLLMMVKNESAIIERALESCLSLIDSYFICDTGSTDDTKQKIILFMARHKIPGSVIDIEWKNFGYSKSIMMEKARKMCKTDYFLFFDAKEIIQTDQGTTPTTETKDKLESQINSSISSIFMLNTVYGGITYRRWSLFRNDQLYLWKSPVHEYLVTTKDNSQTENLDEIQVVVKGSASGYSSEKYMRYAEMLSEYVDKYPESARETYYLAQCYKDANRMDLAIPIYEKRISMGGNEEAFISMLQLYRHYKAQHTREKEMVYYLFKMKQEYPQRLEGLYEGLQYFMHKGDNETAYSFGYTGLKTLQGSNQGYLFLETDVYDYLFLFWFCLVAHFTNHNKEAIEGASLIKVTMPENFEQQHQKNLKFYKQQFEENKIVPYVNPEIHNLHPNIIIIDNVLHDPDKRRNFALQQSFDIEGNFPCKRTSSFATQQDKEMFEKILGAKISYWPDSIYNGSFQYATKNNQSWIHRDETEYSGILFLTPNPPITAGTETFMHKQLKKTYSGTEQQSRILNDDSYNKSKWDILDSVGCLYNRLIILNGEQSHQSRDYFGESKDNGRLFQVFFFNIHREFLYKKD